MRSLFVLVVLLPLVTPSPLRAETPPAAPAVTEQAGPPPSKKLTLGLGLGAVGLLAAGGALGGTALSLSSEQEGDAARPPLYTQTLSDRARLGSNLAIGAYVCFGAGGALALVDLVMLIELARHPRGKKL
jgi:hypothetical protein